MTQKRILFVCRGNTCRSPMAEGVLRHILHASDRHHVFHIDSAGTHAGQLARAPDSRAQTTTIQRGFDIATQRSRLVSANDFHAFDHIIALDKSVKNALDALAPAGHGAKVALMMDYAAHMGVDEVPDPFHGTHADYEHALDLISEAAHGLVEHFEQAA
jgi:protein-tyrosine phosphatase